MAEEEITPNEEAIDLTDDDSSGGMKKMILILIPIILLGVGGGLYFTGMLDGLLGKNQTEEHAEDGHAEAKKGDGHGEDAGHAVFVELPDIIVNLNSNGQQNFMRLNVRLEVASEEDAEAVRAVLPRVIDKFQTFLREMRLEDLRGRAGTYRVRQELLYRVNMAVSPVKVRDVLFQDILIQ